MILQKSSLFSWRTVLSPTLIAPVRPEVGGLGSSVIEPFPLVVVVLRRVWLVPSFAWLSEWLEKPRPVDVARLRVAAIVTFWLAITRAVAEAEPAA